MNYQVTSKCLLRSTHQIGKNTSDSRANLGIVLLAPLQRRNLRILLLILYVDGGFTHDIVCLGCLPLALTHCKLLGSFHFFSNRLLWSLGYFGNNQLPLGVSRKLLALAHRPP
jgi:hypothetical protein